jgi:hypothetical protein
MTNFDVSSRAVAFEHRALVSVFYIPAYLYLSILIAIGVFYGVSLLNARNNVYYGIAFCVPMLAVATGCFKNYSTLSMNNYYFTREYAGNIFRTLPENAILFVNWDPYGFPLYYFQYVEKKREDILVIDQMLLKRTWYLYNLREQYPEFIRQVEPEVHAFLKAVKPFENNQPYDGNTIQKSYLAMINAMIDKSVDKGVYFTYTPEPAIVRTNHLSPVFSCYKYSPATIVDTTISDSLVHSDYCNNGQIKHDRMANYVRTYYGNIYGLRAMELEAAGYKQKAKECYMKAGKFFDTGSQQWLFINGKIAGL